MGNFIVFILILFVLAALLRIDFFFTIVYLLIGVYIVTRFWTRRMLTRLTFKRRLPERAFLGEAITVTLTLENLSILPVPWLLLNDSFSPVLSTPPFIASWSPYPARGVTPLATPFRRAGGATTRLDRCDWSQATCWPLFLTFRANLNRAN